MKQILLALMLACWGGCQSPDPSELQQLIVRLQAIPGVEALPVIQLDSSLAAHSRFLRDTIWLGDKHAYFPTEDDRLSLLYHEYQHKVMQERGEFPVELDSAGIPVQLMTDSLVEFTPDSLQVLRDWRLSLRDLRKADSLTRRSLWESLAATRTYPFRYAPSNLAREEMAAYKLQLEGDRMGLYTLSMAAKQAIQIRLYQLEHTLNLRIIWENAHHLTPSGIQKQRRPVP